MTPERIGTANNVKGNQCVHSDADGKCDRKANQSKSVAHGWLCTNHYWKTRRTVGVQYGK